MATCCKDWGDRRGSNPRHLGPQPSALPAELRPPYFLYCWLYACAQRESVMGFLGRLSGAKDLAPVVVQLIDRIADIAQGAVVAGLLRGAEIGLRVPAAG